MRLNASIENYFIGDQYQCQTKCTAEGFWDETRIKSEPNNGAKPVIDWIEATIDLSTFSSLLDIGCGPSQKVSQLCRHYPSLDVTGIDSDEAVQLAKSFNPGGNYISCDLDDDHSIENIKSILGNHDLIFCLDVIEHVLYPEKVFNLIKTCANENTLIFLTTLERDMSRGPESSLLGSQKPDHIREWNQLEFTEFLKFSEFEIQDSKLTKMVLNDQVCQSYICKV